MLIRIAKTPQDSEAIFVECGPNQEVYFIHDVLLKKVDWIRSVFNSMGEAESMVVKRCNMRRDHLMLYKDGIATEIAILDKWDSSGRPYNVS